jgi:hypothetical protein
MSSRLNILLVALAILALAAWLRFPFINSGMPYFYDEDEGHHYNRVVNMVKSGEFNPQYFLKPSLHFYVRMPVTAFAFLSAVKDGAVRELKEVSTRDPFGLADYSFNASHPKIAKVNRALSIGFSLLTVLLTGIIAVQLGLSAWAAVGAALLVGVSPALVTSSAVIGVDVIVGPLVLASVSLALLGLHYSRRSFILLAAIAAGLAASTKYNAAIVALVPLVAALSIGQIATACLVVPVVGFSFLAGTPYLLAELPLFLNHVAYEIWHYGIAGHVGNEGQPGLPQALHYLRWLRAEGVGIIPLTLSVFAIAVAVRSKARLTALTVTFSFAVLYFAFMCSQKANFTRNMLVLIPFVALAAMIGLEWLASKLGRFETIFSRIAVAGIVLPLLIFVTIPERREASSVVESRLEVLPKLQELVAGREGVQKLGVAGELQIALRSVPAPLSPSRFALADVEKWIAENPDSSLMVLPASATVNASGWRSVLKIAGNPLPMRIVRNPELSVWRKE